MTRIEVNGRWRRADGGRAVRLKVGRYRWRTRTASGTVRKLAAGWYEAARSDGAPGVIGRGRTPAAAIAEAPGPDGAGSWYS